MLPEYKEMELSTQVLIQEALQRGLEVEALDETDNFIMIRKGNHFEYIKQATRTGADTYIAPLIMENKEVTKTILKRNDINVPNGVTVRFLPEAEDKYPFFAGKGMVIKPKSTNFGKGITIFKDNPPITHYQDAVRLALEYDSSVLIEEFIPGQEYRFLVIGDEVPAILHRVPANVKGDGLLTIVALVDEKNQDPLRGRGYVTPLEKINLGPVEAAYLKLQGKDVQSIPANGEIVYLRENSNISTGGDSIDFTDQVADQYKTIAVQAAKAVGARICGADIIIQDIKAQPNETNYSIIELNFNPALHIHDFPYQGQNRHVERKVLDLLGFN